MSRFTRIRNVMFAHVFIARSHAYDRNTKWSRAWAWFLTRIVHVFIGGHEDRELVRAKKKLRKLLEKK